VRTAVEIVVLAAVVTACQTSEPASYQLAATDLTEALLAVNGTSSRDVWAVGSDKGQGPIVLRYDGAAWSRIATGTRGDLWWIAPVPDGPTYLAGKDATILRFDGSQFTRMATPGLAEHTIFGLYAARADDVWAVGSVSGRNGFVWHYDGVVWSDVPIPLGVPATTDDNDAVGFFKVWGDRDGRPYIVGGKGTILHWTGAELELVESPTAATLFTVHAGGDLVVAVGGPAGTIVEKRDTGPFVDRSPRGGELVQGVWVRADAKDAWASGSGATLYQRASDGTWQERDHGFELSIESLHSIWIDPEGGVWAVGGNVVSARLDAGTIMYRGTRVVPRYLPNGGGQPPPPPDPTCPVAEVDPTPDRSIARRWNEQILGAIRRDIPRPGVHARNLFHVSVAMWDAWTAYDTVSDAYLAQERLSASDIEAARREAISYAAYRVLSHRYRTAVGGGVSQACFEAFMSTLGYPVADTTTVGSTPRALGNRIGQRVIEAFANDGANEANDYADLTGWAPVNEPLVVVQPGTICTNPSEYQPLNLAVAETQNGIVLPSGQQGYIGSNWGVGVTPFALVRDGTRPYFDWGAYPSFASPAMKDWVVTVLARSANLDHTDGVLVDISPGRYGNNPLASDEGGGHPVNPATGEPYAPNVVPRGDFARVLAEFWADGPKSETPPGHWDKLANEVTDAPGFARRLGGTGPELDPLAWDVHLYLALNGAVHDAAIAAWELKRLSLSARPIKLVRHMAVAGQASDPALPSYHEDGLPLVEGLIELVTAESSAPGQRHAHLRRFIGQVAVKSWRGEPGDRRHEVGGVAWIRAMDWIPYQRRTFVTPAFPGYVSGHSTFSRAAAEVLAAITGTPYFPGGLGAFTAKAGQYLVFEQGPSVDVRLEWATYFDAADQAGQSRIYGGIHITPDDFDGRRTGHECGLRAYGKATTYWDGSAVP